ncbi:MAG: Nudix hydrolase protein [Patescibacteria group bacterium]|nr:Nudix hydrolase protein [Patescibacteria group bacterium]
MDFLKKEELAEKLKDLEEQGFDKIHLPGGSSWDNSFCSSVIIPVYHHESKDVYFVGVPYNSSYEQSNGNNKKANETPEETALREVMEETGIRGYASDLIFLKNSSHSVPDRFDTSKTHYKNYFLLKTFTGIIFDFEGANHIDPGVAAPLLFPSRYFKEILFKNHQIALKEAVDVLMGEHIDYCYALMNLNR